MANKYWVGDTGNWSDSTHWSNVSGGVGGGGVPTISDNIYFDDKSFTLSNQHVDVSTGGPFYFLNMDWSLATNNPTFHINSGGTSLLCYGSITFIENMTLLVDSGSYVELSFCGTGINTFTTVGKYIDFGIVSFDMGVGTLNIIGDYNQNGIPSGTIPSTIFRSGTVKFNNNINISSVFKSEISSSIIDITDCTINSIASVNTFFGGPNIYFGGNATLIGAETTIINFYSYSGLVNHFATESTITHSPFKEFNVYGNLQFPYVGQINVETINITSPTFNNLFGNPSFITAPRIVTTNLNITGNETYQPTIQYLTIEAENTDISFCNVNNSYADGNAIPFEATRSCIDGGKNTNWLFTIPQTSIF